MSFEKEIATLLVAVATLCQPVLAGGLSMSLVAKGCEQLDRGNYTTAISMLCAAVRQNPADLEARRHLSSAYIGAGMDREAIRQLEALARVAPGDPRDSIMMAQAYYQMGDVRSAIALYRNAMQQDPASSRARMGLARALMSTGDLSGAIAVCNDTLRLTQDPQSRRQFIELLSTIRTRTSIVRTQSSG